MSPRGLEEKIRLPSHGQASMVPVVNDEADDSVAFIAEK